MQPVGLDGRAVGRGHIRGRIVDGEAGPVSAHARSGGSADGGLNDLPAFRQGGPVDEHDRVGVEVELIGAVVALARRGGESNGLKVFDRIRLRLPVARGAAGFQVRGQGFDLGGGYDLLRRALGQRRGERVVLFLIDGQRVLGLDADLQGRVVTAEGVPRRHPAGRVGVPLRIVRLRLHGEQDVRVGVVGVAPLLGPVLESGVVRLGVGDDVVDLDTAVRRGRGAALRLVRLALDEVDDPACVRLGVERARGDAAVGLVRRAGQVAVEDEVARAVGRVPAVGGVCPIVVLAVGGHVRLVGDRQRGKDPDGALAGRDGCGVVDGGLRRQWNEHGRRQGDGR